MAAKPKVKKLTFEQEEALLNKKIRKMNTDLQSGKLKYPAPAPWTGPEQEVRADLFEVLQNIVHAA